MNSAYEFT